MGDLSPDCYACRGVGYVKPGFGMGVPSYGAAPGMIPPYGGAIYPPPQAPVVGYGPPPIYPPVAPGFY